MGKYVIDRGYRNDKRWPFACLVITGGLLASFSVSLYLNSQNPSKEAATNIYKPVTLASSIQGHKMSDALPWPEYGQAAYGVKGGVVITQSEDEEPVPVASLVKVITALAVLEQKPLKPGEQGPTITLSEKDVESYRDYLAKDGTVMPVKAGMKITQYQALQATLLSSSNNISDTLARWAFGSIDEYNAYANNMLYEMGFRKTTVAGASGYSPESKSTAVEMVKLGFLYLENPVLKEIASQKEANMPYVGQIANYNAGINNEHIMGLKVGFTDEAGKTFLVADIKDEENISVVAVLGANTWDEVTSDAKILLEKGYWGYKKSQD